MKIIFLFFAALNIAFFLWQSTTMGSSSVGSAKKQLVQDDRVPTLVLLREAEAIENGKPKDTLTAMLESAPSKDKKYAACYRLGPFEQFQQLKSVTSQLHKLGADISQRKETEEVVLGHWVFLPSFPSWQDARKKVQELEEKGIKDIFILGRGEMKNAVSLGLFKHEASAKRRLAQLKKIGIKPRVETQQTTTELIWLDINVESNDQSVPAALTEIVKGNSDLQVINRSCK
jgi:hypothetical protein